MRTCTVIVDGGTVGSNPGIGVAAAVLKNGSDVVHTENKVLGDGVSNNQAEYHALLLGLDAARRHGMQGVTVLCDSRLVVNQVKREWNIANLTLRRLAREVWKQAKGFDEFEITWVPRRRVAEAHALLDSVRPDVGERKSEPESFHDWLRNPDGLWFHLPDGRKLYKLTYYARLANKTLPSIDLKIWRSLWDRNPEAWIVWRPWGKYPLSASQIDMGLSDLEDGIQEPIMAPLNKIRSEFLEAGYVGKWGGQLLLLYSDAWETVDERLADGAAD